MSENNPPKAGYSIISIRLAHCSFQMNSYENFAELQKKIDVTSSFEIKENKIQVQVKLNYLAINPDKSNAVDSVIIMYGDFESQGETSLPPENFGKANGPAIVYPYLREHLSSLLMKAGLGYHYIPALNFALKNVHTIESIKGEKKI